MNILQIIEKKRDNKELSKEEIEYLLKNICFFLDFDNFLMLDIRILHKMLLLVNLIDVKRYSENDILQKLKQQKT